MCCESLHIQCTEFLGAVYNYKDLAITNSFTLVLSKASLTKLKSDVFSIVDLPGILHLQISLHKMDTAIPENEYSSISTKSYNVAVIFCNAIFQNCSRIMKHHFILPKFAA